MKFAKRLSLIKPSPTLAINAKAMELKKQGIAAISLAVGEPDFPPAKHIEDAAKKAIDDHFGRYTDAAGILEAREAVCTYYKRMYGIDSKPSQVVLSNGGKHTLYNLFSSLLDEGDDVLVPTPYWTSYPDLILLMGANPVMVPSGSDKNFKISVADLEKFYTPKTKVLLLNSPSNPSGATYNQDELDALINWALEKNIFIISDEVYDQLVYAPAVVSTAAHLFVKYPEQIAIVNSASKSFAMTGWRIGYSLASEALSKEMAKLQGQATSNINSISQKALVAALTSSYDCIAPMKEAFQRRRDFAHAEISSWKGVVCPKPEGAFYLFPDVSALFTKEMPNATAMCTYLLEDAKVALMPGEAFGEPNCIRISYAVADDVLKTALAAIKNSLYK